MFLIVNRTRLLRKRYLERGRSYVRRKVSSIKMATKQHAFKRSAQALNVSNTSTPIKATQSKIPKCNNEESKKKETEPGEEKNLNDIFNMMSEMMMKLDKLDSIEDRVKTFEQDLKSVKDSIEFARAEVNDLKIDNEERKKMDERTRQRLEKLENENTLLNKSLIDLQARSMRDNLIFYNIPKTIETRKQHQPFISCWKRRWA